MAKTHIITVANTNITARIVEGDSIVNREFRNCGVDAGLSDNSYKNFLEQEYHVEVFKIVSVSSTYGKYEVSEDMIKAHGRFIGACAKPTRNKQ